MPEPVNAVPRPLAILAQIAALRCTMANCFALVPGVALPHVELILAHVDRQATQVIYADRRQARLCAAGLCRPFQVLAKGNARPDLAPFSVAGHLAADEESPPSL